MLCSFVAHLGNSNRLKPRLPVVLKLGNVTRGLSKLHMSNDNQVKYLGLIFDSNLNWKPYLHELSKKVSRGIGVLSKIRYYVNSILSHNTHHSRSLLLRYGEN